MRYEMFYMKQYDTLGSVDSKTRLIQRQFRNWKWNQFGIGIGLKTARFRMRDRFTDSFGIGSRINLELE